MLRLLPAAAGEENLKRLNRFRTFYDSLESGSRLREAALCLQLTSYAVSITAQKPTAADTLHFGTNIYARSDQRQHCALADSDAHAV